MMAKKSYFGNKDHTAMVKSRGGWSPPSGPGGKGVADYETMAGSYRDHLIRQLPLNAPKEAYDAVDKKTLDRFPQSKTFADRVQKSSDTRAANPATTQTVPVGSDDDMTTYLDRGAGKPMERVPNGTPGTQGPSERSTGPGPQGGGGAGDQPRDDHGRWTEA